MRKRVALAQTLVNEPSILLMDEPFSALDVQTRGLMQDELLRLWASRRKTVIFVTHDLTEAISLADRIVVMTRRPGRVKTILPVPLSRPRDVFHVAEEPGFATVHKQLWDVFASEIATDGTTSAERRQDGRLAQPLRR
jgi:NitT/TauT family transport system ATP-binding protein